MAMLPRSTAIPAATPRAAETAKADVPAEPAESATSDKPAFVPPVVVAPGARVTTHAEPQAAVVPVAVAPVPATSSGGLEDMVSSVVPAVVSIHAGSSRGTGFYVRPDTILTNVHVIQGHSSVDIVAGDSKRTARVVRTSPGHDLAVLQVYNADPRQATLALGSAGALRVGQEVIAVGSALGVLQNTVTRGIVSAMRRAGAVTLIQTDAAINPGNSGGPLVDRTGQVIGVNTMKIAREAESIGFAVAIDHAHALLNGETTVASAPPPGQGLDTMMRGNAPSAGEQQRDAGVQQYEAMLQSIAQAAAQVDDYWTRYGSSCVASSRSNGARPWFAVYDRNAITLSRNSQYNCSQFLEELSTHAQRINAAMTQGADVARRAGVYPGVQRDMRRKYRLDWSGWER